MGWRATIEKMTDCQNLIINHLLHCWNTFETPSGYQVTENVHKDAFGSSSLQNSTESLIRNTQFHSIRWNDGPGNEMAQECDYDVIIIGGGISGLTNRLIWFPNNILVRKQAEVRSCAAKLGIDTEFRVLLIEASDRLLPLLPQIEREIKCSTLSPYMIRSSRSAFEEPLQGTLSLSAISSRCNASESHFKSNDYHYDKLRTLLGCYSGCLITLSV